MRRLLHAHGDDVCHGGLEPRTNRLQTGLLLTRLSPHLDRAPMHTATVKEYFSHLLSNKVSVVCFVAWMCIASTHSNPNPKTWPQPQLQHRPQPRPRPRHRYRPLPLNPIPDQVQHRGHGVGHLAPCHHPRVHRHPDGARSAAHVHQPLRGAMRYLVAPSFYGVPYLPCVT